jgi:hypothetical protein
VREQLVEKLGILLGESGAVDYEHSMIGELDRDLGSLGPPWQRRSCGLLDEPASCVRP